MFLHINLQRWEAEGKRRPDSESEAPSPKRSLSFYWEINILLETPWAFSQAGPVGTHDWR